MNGKVGRALRKEFRKRVQDLGEFEYHSKADVPGGFHVYRERVSDSLELLIVLVLDRSNDKFALEVGWKSNVNWPEFTFQPNTNRFGSNGEVFRIHCFWNGANGEDWWWIGEPVTLENMIDHDLVYDVDEQIARLDDVLTEVFGVIAKHCCGYFDGIRREAQ